MLSNKPSALSKRLNPAHVTFFASLILSFISQLGTTLNRDGMLYVKTAAAFLDGGFAPAKATFNWPFLSILMAALSKLTGLDLELSGHLINALFMAGMCTLLVDMVRRTQPENAWWICLALFSIPGINQYRSELLREYGCWFFSLLALWLALRWSEKPRWITAMALQASIGAAALFRPEALALFPTIITWQMVCGPRRELPIRLMMLAAAPLLGVALILLAYFTDNLSSNSRLAGDINRFAANRFDVKAQALSGELIYYAQHNARKILFWGSLALIPIKLASKLNVFVIPLVVFACSRRMRATSPLNNLLASGIFFHAVILAVFVVDLQFLAGRYVGMVLILLTPFVGEGLAKIHKDHPRLGIFTAVVATLIMLSNVINGSPAKTQYVDAGTWLSRNATESSQVYIESGRAAYYARWYKTDTARREDRDLLKSDLVRKRYSLFVFETFHDEPTITPFLEEINTHIVARFENTIGDAVVIASPN